MGMENNFKSARILYNHNGFQSIQTVAIDTGITKSLIEDLESGRKRGVSYLTVCNLAKYYGVSVDYLLGLTDNPKPYLSVSEYTGLSEKSISEYTGLSEKSIDAIKKLDKKGIDGLNHFLESLNI